MKIRTKILMGFLFMALIGVILGIIGLFSITRLTGMSRELHSLQEQFDGVSGVLSSHYNWRHNLTEAVLADKEFTGSVDPNTCALGKWLESDEKKRITDKETLELLDGLIDSHNYIHTESKTITDNLTKGNLEKAREIVLIDLLPETNHVITSLSSMQERINVLIEDKTQEILDTGIFMSWLIAGLIGASIITSVILSIVIPTNITKPLVILSAFMKKAGTTGDISFTSDYSYATKTYGKIKDELGETIRSSSLFIEHVDSISKTLQKIAEKDLTVSANPLSSQDVLGNSLKNLISNLYDMFTEIKHVSTEVSAGSFQIAEGARTLANGSTEQAATLEELSATISGISEKTKENADRTANASLLTESITENAEKSNNKMKQMMSAVEEINNANQSISQVIKVIDDIAFQTNILALNAAVEAARAGSAGKGFAVVAQEVRNLAAKSAESAKNTSSLIANSMEKSELGTQIAVETAASLDEIIDGIGKSAKIISEIAKSSDEQAGAVSQIYTAIEGVTGVVQQNSATAEESAASSEEMNVQAESLENLLKEFKLNK